MTSNFMRHSAKDQSDRRGVTTSEFRKQIFSTDKTMATMWLRKYDDMLSRLDTVPQRDRQTDGRKDGQNCYISIVCQHCCADAR